MATVRGPIGNKPNIKSESAALERPFPQEVGLSPPLDVEGDDLACYRKTYFGDPAYPEASDSMGPFQFGVRCFNAGTDRVPVLPFRGLLESIHLISQANLRGDLQTEVPGGITSLTALRTMVGRPYWTAIEHRTESTAVPVEDRVEGATGGIVCAEYAMIDGVVFHGALGHQTPSVKRKPISAHDLTGQSAAVDRRDEFNALFFYLQR